MDFLYLDNYVEIVVLKDKGNCFNDKFLMNIKKKIFDFINYMYDIG